MRANAEDQGDVPAMLTSQQRPLWNELFAVAGLYELWEQ
jgi:hypothetical protein